MDIHPAALATRRIVTRLPGRPTPTTRGGTLMLLSALAALARRVHRHKRNRFTA